MAQHSAKGARFQAVTGNRLLDGEVVYFVRAGADWVTDFAAASIADGAEEAASLLAAASPTDIEARILDPYLFEILETEAGNYAPASVREKIRAKGPTIRTDLGKQAGQAQEAGA